MLHAYRRIVCGHCGERIDCPVYCGNRFCPVCSVTRLLRVRRRLEFLSSTQPKLKGHRWQMWTFSVKNCVDLSDGIKHLLKAFRRLRNTQYWGNHVDGGAFVIEVKGRPGNWHPHIHVLLYLAYMDWAHVLKSWRKCSGGRGCYYKDIPQREAVGYLTKYLTKLDIPDSLEIEISQSLKGSRLFAPIGSWHAMNKAYKKSSAPCKKCGATAWEDYDILQGKFPGDNVKDFPLKPRPAPDVGLSSTPMLDRLPQHTSP